MKQNIKLLKLYKINDEGDNDNSLPQIIDF